MKIIVALLVASLAQAASYTSSGSGNWNSNATWGGSGFPGNGDTFTIRDGDVVTCPASVTCIFGTSGTSGTVDGTIGQGSASTAKLINNGTLIARGGILGNPQGGVKTGGYCILTFGAGSTFTWDSHLAGSPSTVQYSYSAGINSWDAAPCSTSSSNPGDSTAPTTGGNHATVNSNSGGGNGYFTVNTGGPFNYALSYVDFTRCGDATHPCIAANGTTTGAYTQLFSLDHCTFTSGGPVLLGTLSATSNFSVTRNIWSDTKPNSVFGYAFAISGMDAHTGGSSRLFQNNSADVGFNNPAGFTPWDGVTYTGNFTSIPTVLASTDRWTSFSNNLILYTYQNDSAGSEFATNGNMSGIYLYWYADLGHRHWFVPTGHATATYDHILFDSDTTSPCTGSDIFLTGSGGDTLGEDFPLNYSIVMLPAQKGCSPGSILQPIGTTPLITLSINHNTDFAQQGITVENTDGLHPYIGTIKNNLFFLPNAYRTSTGDGYKLVDAFASPCPQNLVVPANADYNASWNITQVDPSPPGCFANEGRGYWGNFSATPGVHDFPISDPLFVDTTRSLDTFDIAFLSNPQGPSWSSGTSYTVGQVVSHQSTFYRDNVVVNFRCVQAYTAGASNSEPGGQSSGNGANWRVYWEPATFQDIRNAQYAALTYGGQDIITALRTWVTAGYAPQNRALCGAADDGTDIGAVPCSPTLPVQITGPLTCQQGQTCNYKTTGGTPPYTYSLVSGSVGSIAGSTGVYTAPSPLPVLNKQTFNGCVGLPSDNIFNTRIDNLPVNSANSLWMANLDPGAGLFGAGFRLQGNVVHSTDPPVGMTFNYTTNPGVMTSNYSGLNGQAHSLNFYDAAYTGTDPYGLLPGQGNPALALSPLSLGLGYLTNGLIGQDNPFSDGSTPVSVTGASWSSSGNTSTLTISNPGLAINTGDWIIVTGVVASINPALYNVPYQQVTAATTNSVSYSYANSNPGSWVSGGQVQKAIPHGSQSPQWVGWALDDQNGSPFDTQDTYTTRIFNYAAASSLTSLKIHAANFSEYGIGGPGKVVVDFSYDGSTFINPVTYTPTGGDLAHGSRDITVPLNQTLAYPYTRVHMFHQNYVVGSGVCTGVCLDSNFILASEISFQGFGVPFIFQPFPKAISEQGAYWTAPGDFSAPDNHYLTTYTDTCQQQENYKYYSVGVFNGIFGQPTNSASGTVYPLTSNQLTGVGVDAAQLPISPLLYHQDELIAAGAGNVDAIQHAVRATWDSISINVNSHIWPAQADNGTTANCQGRFITGNGTTTVTGTDFRAWPTGTNITIDSVPYTIGTVSSSTSMTVSSNVSGGSHLMQQPGTNCVPYGGRLRLKSAYTFSPPVGCDTTCQNIAAAVVRQQKRYGIFVADIGTNGEGYGDFGFLSYANSVAVSALGIPVNATNYEWVDESTLQTNQTFSGTNAMWAGVKINNAYVTPDDAVVVQVTDSLAATAYYTVSLQGVAVGVEHPTEVFMAGAAPYQFSPWVTGSTNTAFTCALSPSGGANGTITSGCLYTPAASGSVSTLTTTTVTVTSSADNTVSKNIVLHIIPLSSDGNLHLSLGKVFPTGSPFYTDTAGVVWWNDEVEELPVALFPDETGESHTTGTITDYSGTNYVATAPGVFASGWSIGTGFINDHIFRVHVPLGTATSNLMNLNVTTAANQAGLSLDCNGTINLPNIDQFLFAGGYSVNRPISCVQTITGTGPFPGVLNIAVRPQGPRLGSTQAGAPCLIPCYDTANALSYNLTPGLVISMSAPPPPPSSFTLRGITVRGGVLR